MARYKLAIHRNNNVTEHTFVALNKEHAFNVWMKVLAKMPIAEPGVHLTLSEIAPIGRAFNMTLIPNLI